MSEIIAYGQTGPRAWEGDSQINSEGGPLSEYEDEP